MKVLKREEVIKLLQQGERMIETQWGGYSYSIAMHTVRFDTARYLIANKLVEEDMAKRAPLLKYFKWAEYKKDKAPYV